MRVLMDLKSAGSLYLQAKNKNTVCTASTSKLLQLQGAWGVRAHVMGVLHFCGDTLNVRCT